MPDDARSRRVHRLTLNAYNCDASRQASSASKSPATGRREGPGSLRLEDASTHTDNEKHDHSAVHFMQAGYTVERTDTNRPSQGPALTKTANRCEKGLRRSQVHGKLRS